VPPFAQHKSCLVEELPGGAASPCPPWALTAFPEIHSTQDVAIQAAAAGCPSRTGYIAARQTQGRGRGGRLWQAPEGNLNFSGVLRPGPVVPMPAQWSLMAAVALHHALASTLPSPAQLSLKWPNDVLLDGAKLAGILIDSAVTPEGRLDWVVIGIGVNLAETPRLPDRATTCLARHGVTVPPAELASRLMTALDHWAGQALPTIRAAWLARAHPAGTPLRVHVGSHVIEGIFDGLGEDGSLLLQGHSPIRSAEVFLEAPHAAGG
jgi:BirA family biotin operon repressor/biotin-[acetyl-CoA-carboxylase] ligase